MVTFESSVTTFAALLDPVEVDLVHLRWDSTQLFVIDRDDPEENPGSLPDQVHAALDEQLRYAEVVRLCARAPAFSPPDLPPLTPVTARALIDVILLGPNCRALDDADIPDVTFATPAHADRRARAYAALHVATPDPHSPFNTPADLARTLHLDLSEEADAG